MSTEADTDHDEAAAYLHALLNRSLRIHVTDGRMFIGSMKCTDKDQNIILSATHEYRRPSAQAVQDATAELAVGEKVKVDMVKRFVGLVVVPGEYITRIELD